MDAYGHEIGYHYEDLVKARGDHGAAHDRFAANLTHFREYADILLEYYTITKDNYIQLIFYMVST